jgi:AAA domain
VKDVTDFFEAGGTPKSLMDLVQEAPLWHPGNTSSPLYIEKSEKNSYGVLRPITLSEFMASGDTEIPWCVKSIFPAEGAGILGGFSGWGKTFLLMDLAIDVALGRPWLNRFPTTKGPVLYIDEEGADALNRHRFKKLLAGKLLSPEGVEVHLTIQQGLFVDNLESETSLRETLERLKPSLVIIDALIRVFSGDENSASDMRDTFSIVKRIIRDFKCFILFADHQGKQSPFAPQLGMQVQRDVRGSSEKRAFVDSMLLLEKRNNVLLVEHAKSRHGMAVESFAIKIEDTADNTATIVSHVGDAKPIREASRLAPALEYLEREFNTQVGVFRSELIAGAKQLGISERAIDSALKSLEGTNLTKEFRMPESGPGGKKAYYVRRDGLSGENNSFHPGSSIYVEKNYSAPGPNPRQGVLAQIQTVFPGAKVVQ